MTVMLFQLEGSDETLQEGFRTINNAIDKLSNPVVRVIGPAVQTPARGIAQPKNGDESPSQVLDTEVVEEEVDNEEAAPIATKTAKSGIARKFAVPGVLDLDLTAGNPPLKQYLDEKKPATDIKDTY